MVVNKHKKEKVKPVIAHPERLDKNTRKMAKMMNKMNLNQSGVKAKLAKQSDGSSDDSGSESDDQQMEGVQVPVTKTIQKRKKPLSRSYYQALKKNLRRQIKDGIMPDIGKLDKMLE